MLDIIEDGVLLYDKDSFFSTELRRLQERLERQGAKKVQTKRGHFWVLKPDIKLGEVVEI